MSIGIDPTPIIEDPPGSSTQIKGSTWLDELMVKIGLAPAPASGAPTSPPPAPKINWPAVQAYLESAWPGYNWPSSYDAELVATNFADILGRLGAEAVYNWQAGISLQVELAALYHAVVVLQTDVSALATGPSGVSSIPGLTGDLASLQTEIQQVAATAWSNLWSLYNNQVVPLADQVAATAWSNLWSLYNNQVVPLANAVAQGAYNDLWSLYNNQVVPLVADEANQRANGDAALSSALTQETATRQANEGTLAAQVTNETARATGAESNIITNLLPAGLAGVLASVQPQLDALKTETDECLAPLCDTVTPNAGPLGRLGSLLSWLEAGGFIAALVALLVEAKDNPAGLASDIESDLSGAVGDAFSGFKALVGLP